MKLKRSKQNPILAPTGSSWESLSVFNAAAFEFEGSIHLVYRAHGKDKISRFGIARVSDSSIITERAKDPIFEPDPDSEYEALGVEDPRITEIDNNFFMTYVGASYYPPIVQSELHTQPKEWRVRVSLARTYDFKSFNRYGVVISHIDSKDAALFPEKIEDNYLLIHRVIPQIRLAVAPNGRDYKERGPLFGPREGMWDSLRVGIGAPPIKCPFGWLLFYHGIDKKHEYRLGLALLDIHNPGLVLARTQDPILEPEKSYEKRGLVNNIVFTCGVVETDNEYLIYYGAADSVLCLATIDRETVLKWAKKESTKSTFHEFEQVGKLTTEETSYRRRIRSRKKS